MASALIVALAEGVPPTADSPSVVEALVVMENSIVGESPEALFDPSADEGLLSYNRVGKVNNRWMT